MSITISFSFADTAAAAEFLALTAEVTNPLPEVPAVEVKASPAKKSVKTEAPAPIPPTAVEEAPPLAAQQQPVMEYAPLAERITKLIGASNPKRAENRQAIKDFFGECAASYGTPVKSGQDVRVEDRMLLAGLLKSLESANG